MLNKFIEQWNGFWYKKAPPHALALFRIAFGLYLIAEALTYVPHVAQMFSNHALAYSSWAPYLPPILQSIAEPPPPSIAWFIACVYLFACIGLMLGLAMRTSLIILALLFLYYWQLSFFLFPSSYHRIYFFTLCVLLMSGADKTFSLRMLRTHRSFYAWEPVSVFPQRLLAVQVTVTYLGVGLQKAWLPAWQDGAVLSHSLIGRWATPLGRWVVSLNFPFSVYSASVFFIKMGEVFLPFFLWMKSWRWLGVVMGAAFHIGIALLMSIWWFIALIPAYILFWQPEEVYMWCKKKSRGNIL